MNFTSIAQPWAPQAQTVNAQLVLPTTPNHPMFAKWWPANWQWCEITKEVEDTKGKTTTTVTKTFGAFVPLVEFESIRPGVNGVRQIRGEVGDVSNRIGQLQREGWVYLDPKRADYMRQYPCKGGMYYADKFTNIRVLANRMIKEYDNQAYYLWCLDLLINGTFGQPEPHFWQLYITDYKKRPERLYKTQHIPEIKARIDIHTEKMRQMELFITDYKKRGIAVYKDIL